MSRITIEMQRFTHSRSVVMFVVFRTTDIAIVSSNRRLLVSYSTTRILFKESPPITPLFFPLAHHRSTQVSFVSSAIISSHLGKCPHVGRVSNGSVE